MPKTYKYLARDQYGEAINGVQQGTDQTDIAQQLLNKGLIPITIRAQHSWHLNTNALLRKLLQPRVPLTELLLFAHQLYSLIKAGIPLAQSVQRLAQTCRHRQLKTILTAIGQSIASGEPLSRGMRQYHSVFSELVIHIIEIGEATGHLEDALQQICQYYELEQLTIRRLRTALRYPAFVLMAIITAFIVINAFVIPSFAALFASFKEQLPWATLLLIHTSNWINSNWILLLSSITTICLTIIMYVKTPRGKRNWHRWQLKIPIIGSLLHRILMARFARMLALISRAGLPIQQGIIQVGAAMGNVYTFEKIEAMQQHLQSGDNLTQAADKTGLFSALTLQMLTVGEETGLVDEMMDEIAGFYEREIDFDLKRINDAIEPILIVGIGILVLILALAVFLPMWDIVKFAR